MTHVGWFIFWTYKVNPDYRVVEFFDYATKGFSHYDNFAVEREGEEYVAFLAENLRKEGVKHGYELDRVWHNKAYIDEAQRTDQ